MFPSPVFLSPAVRRGPHQATVALLQLLLPRQAQGPGRRLQLPGRQTMDEKVSEIGRLSIHMHSL